MIHLMKAEDADSSANPAIRLQILATEHWSLLASRSTAQSEVLSRISILLTLVSAGLVSLALIGQATKFDALFGGIAVAVVGFVLLVGILTQARVSNVGIEDLMYVLAMNRLRGHYARLDPQAAEAFMASPHDDRMGSITTYYFLGRRSSLAQFIGSTMMFIIAVNAALIAAFVVAVARLTALPGVAAASCAIVIAVAFLAVSIATSGRRYFRLWHDFRPQFPTQDDSAM